jgi:glycosyltransferase involved in cell wall biosynthesis
MKPKLSAVVVSYNMARELPRTLRSLSPSMQRDIAPSDYEVIVVDNGSTRPFEEAECRRHLPALVLERLASPTVSPVPAINRGLAMARGELVGVFIDGARLASPGLLATALAASRLHERPVIGTIAFHLGPEIQAKSILSGYDQGVEDALLRSVAWEEDGYRLFAISTLAASSRSGWFATPAETNALFLDAAHWRELGGYDPNFVSPGGGLANLDLWARVCADPLGRVIMLLGEATFHQVHGGVATNARAPMWPTFHEEYLRLRGRPYERPTVTPHVFGRAHPAAAESLRASLDQLASERRPA